MVQIGMLLCVIQQNVAIRFWTHDKDGNGNYLMLVTMMLVTKGNKIFALMVL